MSIRNVKLPAHMAGLPGKEMSFILCPLTPPIPLWRDGARSGQHNYYETYGTGTRSLIGEIPSLDRLSQESSQPDGRVQVLQDSKHTDDSFRGKSNS